MYYLSRCAFTTAEWMTEKDVSLAIVESAKILSASVQLVLCESDSRLHAAENLDDQMLDPWIIWITESVWHYEWAMRYYEACSMKYNRLFNREHRAYFKLISVLREYYHLFPRTEWADPPQYMPEKYWRENTEEAYREYYLAECIRGRCYYKIPPPFWIPMKLVIKARAYEPEEVEENSSETILEEPLDTLP